MGRFAEQQRKLENEKQFKSNDSIFEYVQPKNIKEAVTRNIAANLMKDVREPYCSICCELLKDSPHKKVLIGRTYKFFCEFCFNCQMNM
jgi:hypothetical protein